MCSAEEVAVGHVMDCRAPGTVNAIKCVSTMVSAEELTVRQPLKETTPLIQETPLISGNLSGFGGDLLFQNSNHFQMADDTHRGKIQSANMPKFGRLR